MYTLRCDIKPTAAYCLKPHVGISPSKPTLSVVTANILLNPSFFARQLPCLVNSDVDPFRHHLGPDTNPHLDPNAVVSPSCCNVLDAYSSAISHRSTNLIRKDSRCVTASIHGQSNERCAWSNFGTYTFMMNSYRVTCTGEGRIRQSGFPCDEVRGELP